MADFIKADPRAACSEINSIDARTGLVKSPGESAFCVLSSCRCGSRPARAKEIPIRRRLAHSKTTGKSRGAGIPPGTDVDSAHVMDTILAKALGQEVAQLGTTEKQLLLSRLLGRLAHEIRNPLSSLDIHVQLLEEDLAQVALPDREKLTDRLAIIHGELHRLDTIVKQFLHLAGPSSLDLEPVEITKVVEHVCKLLRPEAATREIEIVTRIPSELPSLRADSVRLTQALLNIVINALQAVEHRGQVRVEVDPRPAEQCLAIRVSDTGPGLPREKLGHIFDPYFTTKAEGSGLGLWIAQQIAAAHGGDIQAANAPNRGAVFTLRLPLHREESALG